MLLPVLLFEDLLSHLPVLKFTYNIVPDSQSL